LNGAAARRREFHWLYPAASSRRSFPSATFPVKTGRKQASPAPGIVREAERATSSPAPAGGVGQFFAHV